MARVLGGLGHFDVSDGADLPDRRGRRRVLMAAHHQRRARAAVDYIIRTEPAALAWCCWSSTFFLLMSDASSIPRRRFWCLTPLLLPIALAIGVDPIHFGIIMVTNLSIGTFTPPFGVNIFVAQSIFDVPLRSIYAGRRAIHRGRHRRPDDHDLRAGAVAMAGAVCRLTLDIQRRGRRRPSHPGGELERGLVHAVRLLGDQLHGEPGLCHIRCHGFMVRRLRVGDLAHSWTAGAGADAP